jgi:uncharacterized protein
MWDISKYYIFLIPIFVWFFISGVKVILFSLKHGWNLKINLIHVGYGHMPSAHTAFVVSLVTSVGYYTSLASGAFTVALILAILTIDDSIRLRMYIGDQGIQLNRLIEHLNLEGKEFPHLKERMGHKISEVIVGAILGFFITLLIAQLLS